jgi:ABC-type nitrate/sulfonate/bicarbonate transport system substrate-binding protein
LTIEAVEPAKAGHRNFNRKTLMIGHHAFRGMQALALALAVSAGPTAAHAETRIKLVLNWKYEGPQGMFFLAQDRGYFRQQGLDVTFDQGNGSGAAVPQVANGAYDMGFGDINALVEFAAKKPDEAPVGVFMIYNRPPFTVAVKSDSPIQSAADFPGHKLGGPANDGALKLFPALCSTAKIDCAKVEITNMQPNLREQMLMQGQVDGIFGYVNTIRFSAKLSGIDPDKQLRFIKYDGYGMDLYSNAIIVSRKFVHENPAAVKGFFDRAQPRHQGRHRRPEGCDRRGGGPRAADQARDRAGEVRGHLGRGDESSRDCQDRPWRYQRRADDQSDRHPGQGQGTAAHPARRRSVRSQLYAAGVRAADLDSRGDVILRDASPPSS